jgi:hypothetical protein
MGCLIVQAQIRHPFNLIVLESGTLFSASFFQAGINVVNPLSVA